LQLQPRFATYYPALCDFFLGERYLIGHNVSFDVSLLRFDLSRISKMTAFPWPPVQICTVDATLGIRGHRLKLAQLYEIATGEAIGEAHRAIADVLSLHRVVLWCIEQGHIRFP
jgi:DNA polymerase III epsilon subunit-like protein